MKQQIIMSFLCINESWWLICYLDVRIFVSFILVPIYCMYLVDTSILLNFNQYYCSLLLIFLAILIHIDH